VFERSGSGHVLTERGKGRALEYGPGRILALNDQLLAYGGPPTAGRASLSIGNAAVAPVRSADRRVFNACRAGWRARNGSCSAATA